MQRKPSAADDGPEPPTGQIAQHPAEHGSPTVVTGRHRMPRGHDATVTTTPLPNRSLTRRLAPLAVGAAAMLVATTVATVVQSPDDEALASPDLSSVALQDGMATADPTSADATPSAPAETSETAPTSSEEQAAAERHAEQEQAEQQAAAEQEQAEQQTAAEQEQAEQQAQQEAETAAASSGGGTQAAEVHGWTHVGGDEFNGGMSDMWGVYDGAGHAGNGTRTPEAISVENGKLVIRGDSEGNTGGMAWGEGQRYGRWEMRAKFPAGDAQYHPVLILWPTNHAWPEGGEVDFAETTSASDKVSFFLHYGSSNSQEYAHANIDITQWHNYAVEWVEGRITGYIDGEKWFESTDPATMPPGKMHATIQLDYFPDGGSPQPTEMYVDYMRMYK